MMQYSSEADEEDLGDLPLEVLPGDGSTIGNLSAREALSRVAERQISEEEYATVKDRLVGLGLILKGQGRGGSVRLADGNAYCSEVIALAETEGAETVRISAQVEAELVELGDEERTDYLEGLGVSEGGLRSLIRATYRLLGLRTYFTTGEKETRAWTFKSGMTAPQTAGVIHTDFERGFIRAQTIGWEKLLEAGSLVEARNKGWLRSEGKEYVVAEGDVMEFLFNV
jgi:hypothetical protein